ncbi:hypothetical protein ABH917_003143 [Thermobifida halotolerans]
MLLHGLNQSPRTPDPKRQRQRIDARHLRAQLREQRRLERSTTQTRDTHRY